ncbi:MAG: M12 family metallo-peptidase [Nitrospirales bacterium]|nr:M12 family metallo-peptidase [Nitrospirales bacterium]
MKQSYVLILILVSFLASSATTWGQIHESAGETLESRPFEIQYFETLSEITLYASKSPPTDQATTAPQMLWSFEAFGRQFRSSLKPNRRLIEKIPQSKRRHVEKHMRFYRGRLEGIPDSWVRLTHTGSLWSGMIWDGQEAYIIDSLSIIAPTLRTIPVDPSSGHVIYRVSDTRDLGTRVCGMAKGGGMPFQPMQGYDGLMEELRDRVGVTARGATRNLDMAVVTDQEFGFANADPEAAVIARMNVVDGIFSEQLGVQISLVDVLPLQNNGGLTSTNANTLLNQFSELTSSASFNHPGVAHLFTGRMLDGDTVGIAFLRSLCDPQFGVGVNQVIGNGTAGALTVAHELGHNFGAPHDDEFGSPCASTPGIYLMNPFVNGSDQFSPCSLAQIQPVLNGASCLTVINIDQADLEPRFQLDAQIAPLDQAIDMVLSVTNYGQASSLNAKAVIDIPAGLTLIDLFTNAGSCTGIGTNQATCSLQTIPPGEERLITLSLKGDSTGSFTLLATVSADNDSNTANNTARGSLKMGNEAPQVSITNPSNGAFLFGTRPMKFDGQAHDAEDGDLTDSLAWTSDRDGQIGTGGTIKVRLSPGLHTIRASATDRNGQTTTATMLIVLSIEDAGPLLFEAHFETGADEFMYVDDAFRNTREPHFAQGTLEPKRGFSGGGLQIQLGGLNHSDIMGMSGGWRRTFTLEHAKNITLSFRYDLTQASDYENDEISEALLLVDDRLIGIDGSEILAQLMGNGNGGPPQTTGWIPVIIPLGMLDAGPHHITIGAFNNKKTYQNETTEILIDDVEIRGMPITQPSPPFAPKTLHSWNFDKHACGFSFADDLFRGTRQPAYAQGAHVPKGGFSKGGLQILLGGQDNRVILGMSGGWHRKFTVPSSRPITLTFRYSLTQAANYEPDERSEGLVSIDGRPLSPSRSKVLARLRGDGNGGAPLTTGWTQVTIAVGKLSPGSHTIAIGAYNNKKTFNDEITEMLIDDILIQQDGRRHYHGNGRQADVREAP